MNKSEKFLKNITKASKNIRVTKVVADHGFEFIGE